MKTFKQIAAKNPPRKERPMSHAWASKHSMASLSKVVKQPENKPLPFKCRVFPFALINVHDILKVHPVPFNEFTIELQYQTAKRRLGLGNLN